MIRPEEKIWIAWERHRRTIELNKVFSCKLYILTSKLQRIFKYPLLSLKTWKILHKKKPKILLVQNPSIVLTLLAILLKPFYKWKLIVDAHNFGVQPGQNVLKPLNFIFSFLQKRANLTIVTNEGLANLVRKNGGTPYILPDKIPTIDLGEKIELNGQFCILYICTFSEDEPFMEVIKAADLLNDDVYIYITGAYTKWKKIAATAPSNIIFTGYLSEKDYWTLLHSVNFTLDLTLLENCLVCGAYESISTGTPMILSDTKALKEYFYKGSVYTLNNAASIARSIAKALEKEPSLRKEVKELNQELSSQWKNRVAALLRNFET